MTAAAQVCAPVCRWPGCARAVAAHHWGCSRHWFALPPSVRTRLREAYRTRQARGEAPTAAWYAAHRSALAWIEAHGYGRAAQMAREQRAALLIQEMVLGAGRAERGAAKKHTARARQDASRAELALAQGD